MGAFATNRGLCPDDLGRLQEAVAGDLASLIAVCRRFEVPLLAAAMRHTGSVSEAYPRVEPTLSTLCDELLGGALIPEKWSTRALELLAPRPMGNAELAEESEENLSGSLIGEIPRIARRRAVAGALPQLPLPELTAILLRHIRDATAEETVGLAADSEEAAQQFLERGERQLNEALAAANVTTD